MEIQSILFLNVFSKIKNENFLENIKNKFEYFKILRDKIDLFCFILYNFCFLCLKINKDIYTNELFLCVCILSEILLDDYNINKIKFFHILKYFNDFSVENLLEYQIDLIKIIFNLNSNESILSVFENNKKIIDYNESPIKKKNKTNHNSSDIESDNSQSIDNMLEEITSNFRKKSNRSNSGKGSIKHIKNLGKNKSKSSKDNSSNYQVNEASEISQNNSLKKNQTQKLKNQKIYKNESSHNEEIKDKFEDDSSSFIKKNTGSHLFCKDKNIKINKKFNNSVSLDNRKIQIINEKNEKKKIQNFNCEKNNIFYNTFSKVNDLNNKNKIFLNTIKLKDNLEDLKYNDKKILKITKLNSINKKLNLSYSPLNNSINQNNSNFFGENSIIYNNDKFAQ